MLQFFDAHVRDESLSRETLDNFAYFNVKALLVAAHAPRPFRSTDEILGYFNELVTSCLHRLVQAGLTPWFAIGVHPRAVPRRAHYDLWQELPQYLQEPGVVAMGELSLEHLDSSEEALLARQLSIAASLHRPVLVTAGRRERARKVRRILEILASNGIPPSLVLINHLDYTCIRPVLEAGCWLGVTVSPSHLSALEAADMLKRYGREAIDRGLISSGFRLGASDVLAMPKAAIALSERGFSVSQVRRLVWSNAHRLFLQERSAEAADR